jgi:predicted O-methyltransferase YrrM
MRLADVPIGVGSRRHWTPRYVRDRVRQYRHDRGHPDEPWLTPAAVRLLGSLLRPGDRGAEFGSGRSTVWFAERVSHLTSVEHDAAWHATVCATLAERGLANVDYILAPRDQPDEYGQLSGYTRTTYRFLDASLDFALIDGLYRDHVTRLMMSKIKPGGLLIIDNANWYLPSASASPNSRSHAAGPDGAVWEQVTRELAGWRSIWAGSGVWDTAIFIKR